jgi:hypothetical protein
MPKHVDEAPAAVKNGTEIRAEAKKLYAKAWPRVDGDPEAIGSTGT